MRDEETARIAVEASLTGHLVMSTLHTNSAPESIGRLLEIGLDPFNFSDSLLAILAQRLVRRLCTHCRVAVPADDEELDALAGRYLASGAAGGVAHDVSARLGVRRQWQAEHGDAGGHMRLYRRTGCAHCSGHGYLGRLGIHELMLADDTIRHHIRHREDAGALQADGPGRGDEDAAPGRHREDPGRAHRSRRSVCRDQRVILRPPGTCSEWRGSAAP